MIPKTNIVRCRRGVSLVNTMVAISVLFIVIIGTANSRYHATLDSRRAAMLSTAARTAVTLSESWGAVNGVETYDPVENLGSDLTITQNPDTDVEYDETFTLLGSYTVVLNDASYDAILLWKDVSTGLRALNVVVTWPERSVQESGADKSFNLTTYALVTN